MVPPTARIAVACTEQADLSNRSERFAPSCNDGPVLDGSSQHTLRYRAIARCCQASGPGTARVHPHVCCRDVLRRVNRVRRVISGRHRSGTLVSKQSTVPMSVPSYHVSRLICFQHPPPFSGMVCVGRRRLVTTREGAASILDTASVGAAKLS